MCAKQSGERSDPLCPETLVQAVWPEAVKVEIRAAAVTEGPWSEDLFPEGCCWMQAGASRGRAGLEEGALEVPEVPMAAPAYKPCPPASKVGHSNGDIVVVVVIVE